MEIQFKYSKTHKHRKTRTQTEKKVREKEIEIERKSDSGDEKRRMMSTNAQNISFQLYFFFLHNFKVNDYLICFVSIFCYRHLGRDQLWFEPGIDLIIMMEIHIPWNEIDKFEGERWNGQNKDKNENNESTNFRMVKKRIEFLFSNETNEKN